MEIRRRAAYRAGGAVILCRYTKTLPAGVWLLRLRISHKLLIAFLAVNLALVVAMVGLIHHSFRSGFLEYLNRVDASRLEVVADELSAYYDRAGTWDVLAADPRAWARLIMAVERPRDPQAEMPAERDEGERGRHPPPAGSLLFRLALTSPDGRLIAGNPRAAQAPQTRIVSSGGHALGTLHLLPLHAFARRINTDFAEHQVHMAYAIGAALLVAAFIVALVLSRQLVAPVRRLADAMRGLAGGDYGLRVREPSRDEIGRLANDFNALAETLERNENLRRSALAEISHELRTPLAILRGELQALEDGVREFDRSQVESLSAEVERLHKLVDDLYQLSLADIGALSYHKREVDLGALLDDALSMYEQRLASAGLELIRAFDAAAGLKVFADPERLMQLFANLFENSLRYTDSPGVVSVRALREDAASVTLLIEDSAPGVPASDHERVFERLYRVESSRSRATGGAGLGLAICRNIVEAHGGRIGAGSSVLGGVKIEVRLPVEG